MQISFENESTPRYNNSWSNVSSSLKYLRFDAEEIWKTISVEYKSCYTVEQKILSKSCFLRKSLVKSTVSLQTIF